MRGTQAPLRPMPCDGWCPTYTAMNVPDTEARAALDHLVHWNAAEAFAQLAGRFLAGE